ncbi:dTMP kinase [Pseudofrankia inefficax]|uniref:dTMP kinase n=1 Tax=Pseudofrankia inefficax (strain DSM 45817 / CECT 9037 / DDB 130130 / EuI1c) TaxID=298654 RepID=UPI0001BFB49E|nr:thymidylate kinase [Pseudofrankia inefficax]
MIVLVGVDGAGKSTAARRLANELTASGTPARYFENAGGRPIIDALAHRLGRRDGRHLLGNRGYLGVEVTIRWLAITRAVTLSTLTRRVAVMDRYTYCQYAIMRARGDSRPTRRPTDDQDLWEAIDTSGGHGRGFNRSDPQTGGHAERLVRLLYAPFPKPDATFYLAVPPEKAARRVQARGRDVEDPIYLAAFAAAYHTLPEFPGFTVIDASGNAEELLATIQSHRCPLND